VYIEGEIRVLDVACDESRALEGAADSLCIGRAHTVPLLDTSSAMSAMNAFLIL